MIGFSLPYVLFMEHHPDGFHHCLLNQYKRVDHLLNRLKQAGVTSIEIRVLPRKGDSAQIQNTLQMIWEMGFQLTVHGALEGHHIPGEHFVDLYPSMEYILDHYHRYQNELMVTVHALCDVEDYGKKREWVMDDLTERTIRQLSEWSGMVRAENLPTRFALEINRHKPAVIDPGDTIEGVLRIVEAVQQPNVGICWDMGHYYSNVLSEHDLPEPPEHWRGKLPPAAFLQRIFHTHIHGLSGRNHTHFPLTARNSLPFEPYMQSLMEEKYQGIYNLELSFHKWSPGILDEGMLSSIQRVNHFLASPLRKR